MMSSEAWVGLGGLALGVVGFILRGYVSKPDALRHEVDRMMVTIKASMEALDAKHVAALLELKSIVADHIRKCEMLPAPEMLGAKLADFRTVFAEHVSEDRAFMLETRQEAKSISLSWETLNRSLAVIEERIKQNSTDADHVRTSIHGLRESMQLVIGRLDLMRAHRQLPVEKEDHT